MQSGLQSCWLCIELALKDRRLLYTKFNYRDRIIIWIIIWLITVFIQVWITCFVHMGTSHGQNGFQITLLEHSMWGSTNRIVCTILWSIVCEVLQPAEKFTTVGNNCSAIILKHCCRKCIILKIFYIQFLDIVIYAFVYVIILHTGCKSNKFQYTFRLIFSDAYINITTSEPASCQM